jgi:hypothetical protein
VFEGDKQEELERVQRNQLEVKTVHENSSEKKMRKRDKYGSDLVKRNNRLTKQREQKEVVEVITEPKETEKAASVEETSMTEERASFHDEHPNAVEPVGPIEKVKTPKSKKKIVLRLTQRKSLNNSKEQSDKKPSETDQDREDVDFDITKKIENPDENRVFDPDGMPNGGKFRKYTFNLNQTAWGEWRTDNIPCLPGWQFTIERKYGKRQVRYKNPAGNVFVSRSQFIKNLEPDWNYRLFIKIRYNNYKVAEEQLFKDPGLVRMKENLKGVDYFRRSVVDHFRKFKFELSDDQLMKIFDDSNSLSLSGLTKVQ